MATEFESERERLATITDLRLEFKDAREGGKNEFTVAEILDFLDEYAKKTKIHK